MAIAYPVTRISTICMANPRRIQNPLYHAWTIPNGFASTNPHAIIAAKKVSNIAKMKESGSTFLNLSDKNLPVVANILTSFVNKIIK